MSIATSVNTNYLTKVYKSNEKRSDIKAALLAKAAGFSTLDLTPTFLEEEDWEAKLQFLSEFLHNEGLTVEQSHAPFNRYGSRSPEKFLCLLERNFIAAKTLGTKYVVIHADEFPGDREYDSKAAIDYSYSLYAPYVEYAVKNGFSIAVENLFDEIKNGRNRCTATVEEQLEIINKFNDKAVSACWDFGHGFVQYGKEAPEKMRLLGDKLTCTHIHDNNGEDRHLPIFAGSIDWTRHAEVLKEIKYNGVYTFEFVYNIMPENLIVDFLKTQSNAITEIMK